MSYSVYINNEVSTHTDLLQVQSTYLKSIKCSNYTAKSYATVTMNNSFPTKEQPILIDAIDNITMKDYVHAVAKITGSESIRSASRICNGHIYISTERLQHKTL